MMMQMMIMLIKTMSERQVIDQLKEAIEKYDLGGGGKDKSQLGFALVLASLKFCRDKDEDIVTMIKRYSEMEDWMKLKPKES